MIKSLIQMIITNYNQIIVATIEHIKISLIALAIAMIIAIPLAFLLCKHKKLAEAVLQIAGIIQTIPSLAILGLLIPFVGIGTIPAIIALVLYAIMPIFQNTYTGLISIPQNLEEVATAFGLNWYQRLKKLELPLAMPMILSGIRISLVMIIGTATLAALIGGGGLGTFIYTGINSNNNTEVLLGAILSAVLAIFFSWLLSFIFKNKRRVKWSLGIIAMLFTIGGINMAKNAIVAPTKTIVIAGKMGSEPEILINMYKDLIKQENPHAKVILKPNFGGSVFLFDALKSNKIDIYPEFTGTVLQTLIKTNQKTSTNPHQVYIQARNALQKQNLTYLPPMKYQNGYTLVTTKDFARKYNLHAMSDLALINDKIHAAFDPDFYNLKDGYPGIKKVYLYNFASIKSTESSLRYLAIVNNSANVTDGYTTDAQIRRYNLVTLSDNKHYFAPYQGAPLMKTSFAHDNPKIVAALNKLAGKITQKQMQEMNYLVVVKHEKASKVAYDYLVAHNLLKK